MVPNISISCDSSDFFCESSLNEQMNFRLQNGTVNLLKDQTSYTIPSSASSRTSRKRRRTLNHFFRAANDLEACKLHEFHPNITRFEQTNKFKGDVVRE